MPTFTPAWPLETERLTLRPYESGDLDNLYALQSDPEGARWLYNEPRTLEQTKELLAVKLAGFHFEVEETWISAVVVERASGSYVGDVSLHWVSELHRQGEVGYMIAGEHQGRGFATEAAPPLLAFAFDTMGLHRVVGRIEPRNVGSARVLEKLGMRREADLVENEWVKGEWQSEAVYAILDREWHAAHAR